MADFTWPTSPARAFALVRYTEDRQWNVEVNRARSGKASTRYLPGMRYVVTLTVPTESVAYAADRGVLLSYLAKLRGGANRLLLWNLAKPAPLGTMRGTPTVAATAAVNAEQVSITGTGTLLPGDPIGFGVGGQRVEVVDAVTLPGLVRIEPPLRVAVAAGTAVVWDKPLLRLIQRDPNLPNPAEKTVLPGFDVEFVEE